MINNFARLLSVADTAISSISVSGGEPQFPPLLTPRGKEVLGLLASRNGFYAFESALLVRPLDFDERPLGILQWNQTPLWKTKYNCDFSDVVFFAEDIFGVQFAIKDGSICSFEPETGEWTIIAASLDEWSKWILNDPRMTTGWPLAHAWQAENGIIELGMRLLPKKPFVLGGQFSIENLYTLNDVEGMRFRAGIANQIRDCPDGSKVVVNIQHPSERQS